LENEGGSTMMKCYKLQIQQKVGGY